MSAQLGNYKNWLSRPDSVRQPAQPAPAKEEKPATTLKIAEGSDVQEGAIRASTPKTVAKPLESYTPGGTYIPLSGGMRGWHENSAVPASEAPNHYGYSGAVEAVAFEQTILERVATFDRRAAERRKVELWAKHSDLPRPDNTPAERAFCTNLSVKGACLRVRRQFTVGQRISVAFFRKKAETDSSAAPALTAMLRNTRAAGGSPASPRFFVGIEFIGISIESKEAIAGLLAGAWAMVPRD
jgi:hypothetical protein